MNDFDETMRRGGSTAVQEAARFFMGTDPVHQTLRNITDRLEKLGIQYAVAGGMALVAHGYDRTTVDVDIVLTEEGHAHALAQLDGLGFVPAFKGSKQLRDTQSGVRVEFLITGQFPGDGKRKPVAFPDPATRSVVIDGIRYVSLETLIEMKLASGMTNPGRLKDLADVQELIRVLKLGEDFGAKLDPYVRAKFAELRHAVEIDPDQTK